MQRILLLLHSSIDYFLTLFSVIHQTFSAVFREALILTNITLINSVRIKGYPEMMRLLNATGRPIGYSCSWPAYVVGEHKKVFQTVFLRIIL